MSLSHTKMGMGIAGAVALALSGCSWSRFEDLRTSPPLEMLDVPDEVASGFGSGVAVLVGDGERTLAFVSGEAGDTGGAVYNVGTTEDPGLEPIDTGHCQRESDSRVCALVLQPAALARARSPSSGSVQSECFASGVGRAGRDSGVLLRCAERFEFALPVPDDVESGVVEPVVGGATRADLVLFADAISEPALVVGARDLGRAFYYEPLGTEPIDLVPSGEPAAEYGRAVATFETRGGRMFAVGTGGDGEVWLFRDVDGEPALVGCLGGPRGIGRTLTAGDVDGDGEGDLVAAAAESVLVFSGASLSELVPTSDATCEFSSLPEGALLTSFGCGSGPETSGCDGSHFGASLAVANVDGEGAAEIVVGAPEMTVRGEAGAGAVLVYTADGELVDTRILSTATAGDRFGASLAAVPQKERDVLLVGAPGSEQAALVYCSSLLDDDASPRCE